MDLTTKSFGKKIPDVQICYSEHSHLSAVLTHLPSMPVSFQCSTGHAPASIVLYPQYLGSGRVGTAPVEELGYVPSVCMCACVCMIWL